MYRDSFSQEFPFEGYFYTYTIDETKPLDQQTEQKTLVLKTKCDIVESSHNVMNTFISAKFVVYVPFDKDTDRIKVKNGDLFESNMYGFTVNGKVVGVFPSQLSGVTVYIQDFDV